MRIVTFKHTETYISMNVYECVCIYRFNRIIYIYIYVISYNIGVIIARSAYTINPIKLLATGRWIYIWTLQCPKIRIKLIKQDAIRSKRYILVADSKVCNLCCSLHPRFTEGGMGVYWIHPDVCPSVCRQGFRNFLKHDRRWNVEQPSVTLDP